MRHKILRRLEADGIGYRGIAREEINFNLLIRFFLYYPNLINSNECVLSLFHEFGPCRSTLYKVFFFFHFVLFHFLQSTLFTQTTFSLINTRFVNFFFKRQNYCLFTEPWYCLALDVYFIY